jgi:hypothetical protein
MAVNHRFPFLALLALLAAVAFAVGLVRLFTFRFETGDVYPAYSSLRTDPLGTRALYDSLAELGRSTRRNFRSIPELPAQPAALLYLGVPSGSLGRVDRRAVEAAEGIARAGGRVVLCLRDRAPDADEAEPTPGEPAPAPQAQPPEPPPTQPTAPAPPWEKSRSTVVLAERWGFRTERVPEKDSPTGLRFAFRSAGADALARRLRWRSTLAFTDLDPAWRTFYTLDGSAVVAERPLGVGTLVLCSDSYPVSNEALWREREPAFLTWLLGTPRTVVFDEAHLGVVETRGVASLARDLGLLGAFPGLAILFLLFAWQRGAAFGGPPVVLPPAREEVRDATAGLVSLLRRSVPPRELLGACLREWETLGAPPGARGEALRRRVRAALQPGGHPDPVSAYRAAAAILAERPGLLPEEPQGPTEPSTAPEGDTP